MSWNTSLELMIWIFNVGRGSAAFIRTPHNQGIINDISCSAEFSTSDFILQNLHSKLSEYKGNKIAQAILTHPHHDHINDCGPLSDNPKLYPTLITCPNDKDGMDAVKWSRIKNRDGNKSIEKYRKLYEHRRAGLETIAHTSANSMPQTLEYGIYWIKPKVCDGLHTVDNEYGNSLSLVTYIRYGKNSILLPGDLTPLAMEKILGETEGVEKRFTVFNSKVQNDHPKWISETFDQPSLKSRLKEHGLSILLAPHHGLTSCYSPELYAAIKDGKPDLVVISEMQAPGEGQGDIDPRYRSESGAKGQYVKIAGTDVSRRTVTTKGHHVLIRMNGSGVPRVYAEQRIEDLMKLADQ